MKLLKSTRGIPIPHLFFVTDRDEVKKIPKGVPYFIGAASTEPYIIRILEYEVLYQKAISTGYPFNFEQLLRDNGFIGIDEFSNEKVNTNLGLKKGCSVNDNELHDNKKAFKDYIKADNYYVDISVIKSLNIFPIWMDSLEKAISVNIQNYASFDTNMYNKKLEGMYGNMVLKSPDKNLIIIDISGSIPRQVSSTCLVLAQNLSESFYADILITGSKSTLYEYERVSELNIETIYEENGTDNDQFYFKKLLEGSEKAYNTVIVFGDEDSPGQKWYNDYNGNDSTPVRVISDEEGKKLNRWNCVNLISFHTQNYYSDDKIVTAYGRWFSPSNIKHIQNWVKDIRR